VRDEDKTKAQLIRELDELRQRIAEREELEAELKQGEEKYRELAGSLPQAVFETDDKGYLTFANRRAFDLFKYTRDDFEKGLNAFDMISPVDRDLARGNFIKVLNGDNLGGIEYTAQSKDGHTFPIEIHSSPIVREHTVVGLRGIIVDLTERKKTEEALRESETKYSALVENSKDGIIMIQEGMLTFINKASIDLVGYSPEEMIGSSFLKFAAPAYRDLVMRRYADRMEGKKAPSIYEIELIRKDGTTVPVELNAIHIEFRGKPTDLAFVRDITERRLSEEALRVSEERFRILVEESPFGVSIIGEDGRYKYLNPRFVEIFGYDLEDTPDGRQWFRKVFPDQERRHKAISAWIDDLRGAEPGEARPVTFTVMCKDGSEKVVHFRPVTMKTGDQFVIYEDVTERKKLEEQLHLAQRMEALGTLAGGIAHNFNNLLTGIMGNTSLMLLDTDPSHPNYERLKAIEKLVDSGSKLTRQLLGYARKGQYEIKPLNINHVVKETADTFDTARKDIRVHQRLAEDLHGIHADQGQVEQILWNLYVNAADAMIDGGDLFIETRNLSHEELRDKPYSVKAGTYVLIEAKDTGSGMDKETMERIFEPFFTTKGLARGTGLGLASVYGMVKAHGGYIDVESRKGEGTTFRIYLPATPQEVPYSPSTPGRLERGKGTILLVDDEPVVLEVSQRLLEMLGYTVVPARGGREAVGLYRAHLDNIDIIILDLIMQDMGGGETYDQLKELNPQAKVLLSSGYSMDGQASEILKRGCDGFIQKPFEMMELSQRIREILDRKRS
jgi:two-component system cell cycle sensor histidine kinase/response regulator CckA